MRGAESREKIAGRAFLLARMRRCRLATSKRDRAKLGLEWQMRFRGAAHRSFVTATFTGERERSDLFWKSAHHKQGRSRSTFGIVTWPKLGPRAGTRKHRSYRYRLSRESRGQSQSEPCRMRIVIGM